MLRTDLLLILIAVSFFSPSLANADEQQRLAWTTSKLKGTPTPPSPYAIKLAFPKLKFDKPTSLSELPGGRMLVSEIGGAIFTFKKSKLTSKPDELLRIDEAKIWHATVHPKFEANSQLFVCYSKDGTSFVSRFVVSGSPPVADATKEQVLLTWPAGGHNGGCLEFGTDGMLYISTGDGSGPNPPDGRTAAQDVSNLFGCVLRIDVDKAADGKNYAVPADNPFVDLAGARPEIWAYGLRNPWKFGVDSKTGNIFAADNGWESWEMVHRIVRGGNCGWPIMEGRAILRSEVKPGPTPIRPPVKDHSHAEANSVIGGPIYRGSKLPGLDGTFIYGDYITGTIWGLKTEGADSYSHQTLVDTDQRITAFAQGSQGEVFVVDYDYTGQIYELVPSGLEDQSADFPRQLSETGLFKSLKNMTPQSGVVPYDVVVKRWMDGAVIKRHWVAIPGDGSIKLGQGDAPAEYPDGTVFVKHIVMGDKLSAGDLSQRKREVALETQILHLDNGVWRPYSYIWDDQIDSTTAADATLVDAAGGDFPVHHYVDEYGKKRGPTWHVTAENECRMCHNAGSGFVLGFKLNQLNRSVFRPATKYIADQVSALAAEKTITGHVTVAENDAGRLVDPFDDKQSLDDRARSYLHGNCSSCHHPRGNAIVSFYLRRDMPFDDLKTNKGTGIGTFGMRNAKLVVPGDPYRSVLMYRMTKLGYGRMPYIGSQAVDSKGVALIEQWIRNMPHQTSADDSAAIKKETKDAEALELLRKKLRGMQYRLIDQEPAKHLFGSTEGALAVALGVHGKSINPMHIGTAYLRTDGPNVGTGVHRSSAAFRKLPSDIRGLFDDFIPPSMRRKTLGRNADPQVILSLKGDLNRGRLIFFSDNARCRNCHDVTDASKSIGPTLADIRKKYKRRSEMVQHVLKPSLKVDDKFAMWVVVTSAGKVHSGLVVTDNDKEIVLRTAERKTIRIPASDVDEKHKSNKSLMPDGILQDLTAQEAADLMQWLGEFED